MVRGLQRTSGGMMSMPGPSALPPAGPGGSPAWRAQGSQAGRLSRSRAASQGGLRILKLPAPAVGPASTLGPELLTLDENSRVRPGWSLDVATLDATGRDLLRMSRSPATRALYYSWWLTFVAFAEAIGELPFPASEMTVERYVTFLISGYAIATIETALAGVSAVHTDSSDAANPTHGSGVKRRLKGAQRFVLATTKGAKLAMSPELFLLLLRLQRVPGWSTCRLIRAKMMLVVGFCCYLRRREILELDFCTFRVAPNAFEVTVCGTKNDQLFEGRQSFIGRGRDTPPEIEEVCLAYLRLLGERGSCACTKATARWNRCAVCGPLFPRIVGQQSQLSTQPLSSKGAVTAEMRTMLSQLPPAAYGGNLALLSTISLRKGGNSAAAANGVQEHVRMTVGRWRGPAAMRGSYTQVTRAELTAATPAMFLAGERR